MGLGVVLPAAPARQVHRAQRPLLERVVDAAQEAPTLLRGRGKVTRACRTACGRELATVSGASPGDATGGLTSGVARTGRPRNPHAAPPGEPPPLYRAVTFSRQHPPMQLHIDLWLWRVTDPVSRRRYVTRYRMAEPDALDLDPSAERIEGSLERSTVWIDPPVARWASRANSAGAPVNEPQRP
jgi:hypothetical protein